MPEPKYTLGPVSDVTSVADVPANQPFVALLRSPPLGVCVIQAISIYDRGTFIISPEIFTKQDDGAVVEFQSTRPATLDPATLVLPVIPKSAEPDENEDTSWNNLFELGWRPRLEEIRRLGLGSAEPDDPSPNPGSS